MTFAFFGIVTAVDKMDRPMTGAKQRALLSVLILQMCAQYTLIGTEQMVWRIQGISIALYYIFYIGFVKVGIPHHIKNHS